MKKKQFLGSVLLLVTAVIWGMAFAFQRVGMEHIGPVTFTASRMTLSAVAVSVFSIFCKGETGYKDENEKRRYSSATVIGGICCGVFLTSASIMQQAGIVYTTAGKAGFITSLYMLLVPVVSFVLFKKHHAINVWIAVVIGVIGMYLLCMSESLTLSMGDGLVFICAVLFCGHILCCDHFAERGNPVRISAVQFIIGAVISWIAAFIMESPDIGDIMEAIVPVLYCGIASGGIGYTLQIIGQKYTEPAIAALIMSLESVFAVIGGAVILGETMSPRETAGCIIIFLAIIIVQIRKKN
ncbi:MAG: DMT family transporter [Lachnospiraceae bacterium]|nr:DMT family transporter [Lachnospiraceae bacterium]